MTDSRPRYTSGSLPPYSYVPGHAPHPVSDPRGHMHGHDFTPAVPLNPEAWRDSQEYLYGVDLFNHGYYWEAHEAWESLWHAAGREGRIADFLKGLIKLAAAGVKAREGNPRGVERHALRAVELLTAYRDDTIKSAESFCGIELSSLIAVGKQLANSAESFAAPQPDHHLPSVIRLDDR